MGVKVKSILFLAIVSSAGAFSQTSPKDSSVVAPIFFMGGGFQVPGGDLADRFGNNACAGGGFLLKTRDNWLAGAGFTYLFGTDIRIEDQVMANLYTSDGHIIDEGGNYGFYTLFERGFYLPLHVGKVISLPFTNPNSGLLLMGSAGYFQHKIRISVQDNSIPQLKGDYKRGYDRLTGGVGISECIGYFHIGNSRLMNYFAGVEFFQSWTKPLRDVNFDTRLPDAPSKRKDLLMGVRIAWMIPIYKRMPEAFYLF